MVFFSSTGFIQLFVGPASILAGRADEGAVLHSRDVAGVRPEVKTVRPLLDRNGSSACNHLLHKPVVFGC